MSIYKIIGRLKVDVSSGYVFRENICEINENSLTNAAKLLIFQIVLLILHLHDYEEVVKTQYFFNLNQMSKVLVPGDQNGLSEIDEVTRKVCVWGKRLLKECSKGSVSALTCVTWK